MKQDHLRSILGEHFSDILSESDKIAIFVKKILKTFDIFKESSNFLSPKCSPHPKSYEFIRSASFVWVFCPRRRGGEEGDGMAFMSRTAKHSDILHREGEV